MNRFTCESVHRVFTPWDWSFLSQIKDGSGGTSQYTAPEVLLSNGDLALDLYKADVFAMSLGNFLISPQVRSLEFCLFTTCSYRCWHNALVFWEILSYVGCENNEVLRMSSRSQRFCQVQHHTAFGDYLLAKFPDISSTSTSSNVSTPLLHSAYGCGGVALQTLQGGRGEGD